MNTTIRNFTDTDVTPHGAIANAGHIFANSSEQIDAPTKWQKMGLQETSSGYGARLNSGRKIQYNGRKYRLYVTQYGNAGSVWFITKGKRIYVS